MNENNHLKLSKSHQKKETTREISGLPPCSQFGDDDYNRYITGEMSLREMESLIVHCEGCKSCLQEILQRHKTRTQKKGQHENEFLFSKTIQFMDSMDKKENLLDIIIKVIRNTAIEVVSTTGELLQPLQPVVTRAPNEKIRKEPFRIIKEFDDPPLSVQVTIDQEKTVSNIGLNISLFDPKADDFFSDKKVAISVSDEIRESISNDAGEVFFNFNKAGIYKIAIGDNEKLDALLTLIILKT